MKTITNIAKAILVLVVEIVLFYIAWNISWWIICRFRSLFTMLKNLIFKPKKGADIPKEDEDEVVEE